MMYKTKELVRKKRIYYESRHKKTITTKTLVKYFNDIEGVLEREQDENNEKYCEMADACLKYKVGFELLAIEIAKIKYLIHKESEKSK